MAASVALMASSWQSDMKINLSKEAGLKLAALCVQYSLDPGALISALIMAIDTDKLSVSVGEKKKTS